MRPYVVLTVCLAGVVAFAACGGSGRSEPVPAAEEPTPSAVAGGTTIDELVGEWTRNTGSSGALETVTVFRGPEHCDWDRFLFLTWMPDSESSLQFVRAGSEVRPPDWAPGDVDADATLPSTAQNTGFSRGGARLFLAADLDSAWVVFESHTERWPRQTRVLFCD